MVYSGQLNYSDVSKRTGVQTTRGPARSSAYLLSRSEWTQINRSKLVWLSMIFPTAICWFILKPQKKLFKKLHNRSPNHQSPFSKYPWTQSGTIWPFQQRRPNQLTNQLGASAPKSYHLALRRRGTPAQPWELSKARRSRVEGEIH